MMLNIFKKIAVLSLLHLSLFGAGNGNIGQGNVGQYSVTIKKLEIFNSTTAKWIVMADSSATVDIKSGAVGASIGAMISRDAAITFGTYTKVRATVGNTFTIRACDTTGLMCTNNTVNNGPTGVAAGQITSGTHTLAVGCSGTANLVAASAVDVVIDFSRVALPAGVDVVGTDVRMETTLTTPFIVNESTTSPSVSVAFDVDFVLDSSVPGGDLCADGANDAVISVDFPTVTISIQ